MPVGRYYKGHGTQVLAKMKARYGDKKGERVFFATANAHGLKPGETASPAQRRKLAKQYLSKRR